MKTIKKHKFFGIERGDSFYKLRLFGIGFKFRSKKLMSKRIQQLEQRLGAAEYNARSAARWNVFLWSNEEKFTAEDYEWYAASQFYEENGYYPNLKVPKTLSEKVVWLKLHYRHPDYIRICDKLEFKKYIVEKLGEGYTIPLLGVYEHCNDIDFDKLPQQFVLKITTGISGKYGNAIVKNKADIDKDYLRYIFHEWARRWLKAHYWVLEEPWDTPSRIIAEEYKEDEPGCGFLTDYKFLCFHGEPKLFWVDSGRYGEGHRRNVYDCEGNLQSYRIVYPNFIPERKPRNLNIMLEIARKLSAPFPTVRVDFYEVDGKVYVGEMTFHSHAGHFRFDPLFWDSKFGELLCINDIERQYLFDCPGPNAKPFTGPLPGEQMPD